jgi:hypothetical protein
MTNDHVTSDLATALKQSREKSAAELAALPSVVSLLVELPLYSALAVTHRGYLSQIRRDNLQMDVHCIYCNQSSTFKTSRSYGSGSGLPGNDDWMLKPGYIDVEMVCQQNTSHKYLFSFVYRNHELIKFGQIPSLEDIAGADIRKYETVLRDGYFGELKRATGLASHGIGIGSFVYLRRIFEKLIEDHRPKTESVEDAAEFNRLRMDDKIKTLKSALPTALVANRATYSILSKGIHELDEETCRKYFPVVRAAIIQILEQDFQARERQKAEADLESEIAKIAGQLK